ncbi:armadillo-type protein [Suillus cothurnatus]|nr:armadillo-type protein [Suillus cothurnatus]
MNLVHTPQVADTILGNEMFTNYDRPRIANLCEKAGLLQRVTSVHHEGLADIKHAIFHTSGLQPESMSCMQDMLRVNIRQKLQVVIQIATKHSDILGSVKLIEMFEYFKTFEGDFHRMPLLYYPSSIVNISEDPEATTRTGQICEVERIYRESNHYKNFLKGAKLPDQLPLIIVYDRFDFVHDLVLYLYQNKLTKFIEVYVQRVNSVRMSQTTIKGLLAPQPNRLKLILPGWSQDPAVFNALAKIFIDSNNKPETFLKKNNLYEPLVVGKFCEARDLYLAYITYAKGFCDDELIDQARYLVKRRQPELRAQVLFHDNIHRRALIDQIVATALPECTDLDDVSVTVKAFLLVDLPIEVIELREKVVIEPSPFSDNRNLENLLLLTLNLRRQGEAKIATDHGLYEQALTIYKKYDQLAMASAQLDGLRIKDVVDSYIKAEDECPSNFAGAIEISSHAAKHDDLADRLHGTEDFLTMINVADILQVGQKCFEYELYQAAKLLFTSISNWSHNAALAMIEHFWEHAPRQEMIQERRGSPRPNEADSV